MELDKWQHRQAEQHAEDNGISEAEAVAELFPDAVAEVPAPEGDTPPW